MARFALAAAIIGLIGGTPALAATVLTENFNTETPGSDATLSQFAITGSIDIVSAVNPYGIAVPSPASFNVLDINGTGAAGRITSLSSFSFNAGDIVTLAFDLGGGQRGDAGDVFNTSFLFDGSTGYSDLTGTGLYAGLGGAGVADLLTGSVFVPGTTAFTTSSISFTALDTGMLRFAFDSPSADNIGPLLDNVSLNITPDVPEPSTWLMLVVGFGLVGAGMRRQQRQKLRFAFA